MSVNTDDKKKETKIDLVRCGTGDFSSASGNFLCVGVSDLHKCEVL